MESGYEFLIGPTVPESMIPDDLKKIFKGDQYELALYALNMVLLQMR